MIQLKLSEEEMTELNNGRYEHPDPTIQKRLNALYTKGLGYPHKEICRLVGIGSTALTGIFKQYQSGGLAAVSRIQRYSPTSKLNNHRETIEEYFRKNPPSTVKEACANIKALTGIERKETQVRRFLHKIGMKPRKAGGIPAKANPQEQEEFKKKDRASFRGGC
ncbi:MAG: transposase [Chlamydiales bacterium]|jgi:transposase